MTLQHGQLMAKKQDLDLLLALRTTAEHDQLQQPAQRPIEKRQNETARTNRHRADPTG
jgi:hypothetical protein